jgi:hypothetical protein
MNRNAGRSAIVLGGSKYRNGTKLRRNNGAIRKFPSARSVVRICDGLAV